MQHSIPNGEYPAIWACANSSARGTVLYIYNDGGNVKLRFFCDSSSTTRKFWSSVSDFIAPNVWTHVAVTQSTPSETPQLYINSRLVVITNFVNTGTPTRILGSTTIGRTGGYTDASTQMTGYIAGLNQFSRTLSASEIAAIYKSELR
jgi:hypothetical protein